MKRALMIIFIQQLFFCGYAQQTELVENLEVSQYANTSYLVAGSLKLKPGFSFVATQNDSFYARSIGSQQPSPVSQGYNFIRTESILVPGALTDEDVLNLDSDGKATTFSYMDGWGRNIQSVAVQASLDKKDIIQPSFFDLKNRSSRGYLPYKAVSSDGRFRSSALTEQEAFYTSPPPGIASDPQAFSSVIYEDSPLERALAATQVGEAYQDKFKTSRMMVNEAGKVRKWSLVSGLPQSSSTYAQGLLTVIESTDEEGAKSRTYTDFTGKTILSEIQTSETEWLQTYYVYSDFGELLFTIPPAAADILSPSQADADLWYYQSLYDDLGRQIASKKPGAGWSYIIYDKWDRPVLTQNPGNRIRNPKEWNFVKYDIHNRPVISGTYVATLELPALRTAVKSASVRDEIRNTSATGYTLNRTYPTTIASGNVYSITYYDDYSFLSNSDWDPEQRDFSYVVPSGFTDTKTTGTVKGLVTGTKSRTTEDTFEEWVFEAVYYDIEYREIQKVEGNILDGIARYTLEYAFSGETLKMFNEYSGSFGSHTVSHRYTYDDQRRPLAYYHQVDNNDEVLINVKEYDDLGNLVNEKLHSRDEGQNFFIEKIIGRDIQSRQNEISYSMDGIKVFGEKIAFENDLEGEVIPRSDGMISGKWIDHSSEGLQILFQFDYDNSGRLLETKSRGIFDNNLYNGINDEYFTYDKNGNILSLDRTINSGVSFEFVDELVYNYDGNQLKSVTDNASGLIEGSFTFKDQNNTGDDYTYDSQGDLVQDKNKSISNISYNYLGLVDLIEHWDYTIFYKYDINGVLILEGLNRGYISTTNYLGELEFTDEVLTNVSLGIGEFDPTSSKYRYPLKDYLGSNWVVFQEMPSSERSIATFEDLHLDNEEQQFLNYGNSVKIKESIFNHTIKDNSNTSLRILGGYGENNGIAKAVSVLPGDTVRMEVFGKYLDLKKERATPLLLNMINSLTLSGVSVGVDGMTNSIRSIPDQSNRFLGLVFKDNKNADDAPPAYLNYLFFDSEQNFKYGGFVQMSQAGREDGTNVEHERLYQKVIATEPGYFYVYLSNDSEELSEAYFDDFSIQVSESFMVELYTYYSSGLLSSSFTRTDAPLAREYFQSKDLNKYTDLYNFHSRLYDPQIGRWHAMDPQSQFASPYVGMGNNPVMMVDPDGEFAWFVPVIIGAVTGGINVAQNWESIQAAGGGWSSFGAAASSFGIGFVAGAGATLTAGAAAPALTAALGTGALSGAALGAIGGGISGFTLGAGNTWMNGGSFVNGLGSGLVGAGVGTLVGGISGGTFGGIKSLLQGNNFWSGAPRNILGPNNKIIGGKTEFKPDLPQRESVNFGDLHQRNQIVQSSDDLLTNNKISQGDFAGKTISVEPLKLHSGAQGKHILGANNYIEGRSILTADPTKLVNSLNSGKFTPVGINSRGMPIVKFGEIIGNVLSNSGTNLGPTQYGVIHISNKGIHIVPYLP